MRRYRFFILVFAVVLVASVGWMASLTSVLRPPSAVLWGYYMHLEKNKIAAALPAAPKIIIAGESAAHFGISAAELATYTGRPAVNMATHASFGLRYLTARALESVGKGDVVVLSYTWSVLSDAANDHVEELQAQLIGYFARDPFHWRYLSSSSRDVISRLVYGVDPRNTKFKWRHGAMPAMVEDSTRFYAKPETLSSGGDPTLSTADKITLEMRRVVEQMSPIHQSFPGDKEYAFLEAFRKAVEERGATVYFAWAPTVMRSAYHSESYTNFFEAMEKLHARAGIAVLNSTEDSLVPLSDTLDTPNHLHSEARSRFTARLAKGLCKHIVC